MALELTTRAVILDRGRVVDSGDHDTLLGRCDLYRTLFYTHLHGSMEAEVAPGQPAGQSV